MTEPHRSKREFDVIVWGASGFTGRLVAEHLGDVYGTAGALTWAIAGRNQGKLENIRDELGAGDIPILTGDSHDLESLLDIARRTRVVCTTVGPYLKHGENMVAACAQSGTDYCDLTGEVLFIRRMIDRYEDAARTSGARIVHSCGFDSLPSELGTLFIQQAFHERYGRYADRVDCRVKRMRGAMSGGTIDSMLNIIDAVKADPSLRKILGNPYALDPPTDASRPACPDQTSAAFDAGLNAWTAPFVMAGINTRNVRRSHALLNSPWGPGFRYTESMLTGRGFRGRRNAWIASTGLKLFLAAASIGFTRRLMYRMFLPKPGEGPDVQARQTGSFVLLFVASDDEGHALRAEVSGDRDPGYGATSRMLGETAVCLAGDLAADAAGGFWTAGSLLNGALIERLIAKAGLSFRVVE